MVWKIKMSEKMWKISTQVVGKSFQGPFQTWRGLKRKPPTGRGFSTLLWSMVDENTAKLSNFCLKIRCLIALCITLWSFRAGTYLLEFLWAVFWKIAFSTDFFSSLQFSATYLVKSSWNKAKRFFAKVT